MRTAISASTPSIGTSAAGMPSGLGWISEANIGAQLGGAPGARPTFQPPARSPSSAMTASWIANAAAGSAIQDAVMALLDERAGGWKVGLAPGAPPSCAPMFASLIHPSPLAIPAADVPMLGVEAEIAVRIGRDLPARATPYTRADIVDAIDGVCAAIEIVHSRLRAFLKAAPDDKLADNVGNGAFVHGA